MQWFNDFVAGAKKKVAQFNNSKFKEAAMATCALIAAADGSVDAKEKAKVISLIQNNELLQVFEASSLGKLFAEYCDKASNEFARLDLLSIVRKLKGDEGASDTALRVALIIANADGNFSDEEKTVVKELCAALGLSADNYL